MHISCSHQTSMTEAIMVTLDDPSSLSARGNMFHKVCSEPSTIWVIESAMCYFGNICTI